MTGASDKSDRAGRPTAQAPAGLGDPATIPCADRIREMFKRATSALYSHNMTWPEYYRRLQAAPDQFMAMLVDSGILFREPEQAKWPVHVTAFKDHPYRTIVRTEVKVGDQLFGHDHSFAPYELEAQHGDQFALYLSKNAIRATLEAVARPLYEEAFVKTAIAMEAGTAMTEGHGPKDDSAAIAQNTSHISRRIG